MTDPSAQSVLVPVCGIGASAGGVEALQLFFRHIPPDLGLAYIVVMHLAPDHASELPAIIRRWTAMPVVQIADDDRKPITPNHVYVIAPGRTLEISGSVLASSPLGTLPAPASTVDVFFRSLASTDGDVFAVVLSGSGSDGAAGARAVKDRGGLVLVQDPSEAIHRGMPQTVIDNGVADVVLPVEDLAARLVTVTQNQRRVSTASFFRDPDAWEAVRDEVIAPLVEQHRPGGPIRAWLAGCATGEEAYTLAILFHEEFERAGRLCELTLFATDISRTAIAQAREGLYPHTIGADVSAERLDRFFRADGEHYRVAYDIRDRVVFAAHNLLHDPPFSRVSLVSCRNVLSGLDRAHQERALRVFRFAIGDDGFLFVGAAETADDGLFAAVNAHHRIYQARSGLIPGEEDRREPSGLEAAARMMQALPGPIPVSEAHFAALERMSAPSVLVDRGGNVVHLSPSAARYFQQRGGPPASKLSDLVRPELRHEVHDALEGSTAGSDPFLSAFVRVQFDDAIRRVGVLAQSRPPLAAAPPDVLVTFLDAGPLVTPSDEAQVDGTVTSLRDKLDLAEQQVETIQDAYHLSTEELRAANEELQSLNEEYRSTTEELETSKEELQSTNEELQTINQELTVRLEEVSRAHSDIANLMEATNVATLFLDTDLHISRYTRQLADIFNIRPRDIDRPITDLRHTLDYQALESDARRVLAELCTFERSATSADGRLYMVRLSPYRTAADHRVDGVVVTFIDLTDVERAETALRESAASKAETSDVRQLLRRLVHVQEAERQRMSRDIHDQMGQQITALRMQIESLRLQCTASPDMQSRVGRVERLAEELDHSIDFLTWELRPAALDRLGLSAALADMVRSWADRYNIRAEYHSTVADVPMGAETTVNLYRIVQESLHNIRKHAAAGRVTVLLDRREGQLTLVVEDDGRGFSAGDTGEDGHRTLGLISMRERTRLLGGSLDIETSPGLGTSIFVRVPLTATSDQPADELDN